MRIRSIFVTALLFTVPTANALALASTGPNALAKTNPTPQQSNTFAVRDGKPLPRKLVSELISKSPVPVVLPQRLSVLRGDPGLVLVAQLEISKSRYQIGLFWRNPHHIDQDLGLAEYAGFIQGQKEPYQYNPHIDFVRKKCINLGFGTTGTEYSPKPPIPLFEGQTIVWNEQKWTFTAMGTPDTAYDMRTLPSQTNLVLAKTLNRFVKTHGIPVRAAKRGYVEISLAPDHGECDANWTLNGRVWYGIEGYNQDITDVLPEVQMSNRVW